jgi:hypothetical protein
MLRMLPISLLSFISQILARQEKIGTLTPTSVLQGGERGMSDVLFFRYRRVDADNKQRRKEHRGSACTPTELRG